MIFNPPSGGFFYDINNIVTNNIKGGDQSELDKR